MEKYAKTWKNVFVNRFDLMYGVTESEKYHLLSPVDLMHGMSEGQRDAVLKEHAKVRAHVSISFFA